MITLLFLLTQSQAEKIKPVIRIYIKNGIRCFIGLKEETFIFDRLNHQYCIVREMEDILEERDFLTRYSIKTVVCGAGKKRGMVQEIIAKTEELNIPVIALDDLYKSSPDRSKAQKETAVRLLRMITGEADRHKRFAVADVGTNNVLLVWAEIEDGRIEVVHRASRISALGKDMQEGMLTKKGIESVKGILRDFIEMTKVFADKIIIIGTSCSRESKNINLLSDWLEKRYNIKYRILSEDEEAELLGRANRKIFDEYPELILFDIGGGSTEFIFYKGKEKLFQKSLPLGIRRLENSFSKDEKAKKEHIRKLLSGLPAELLKNPVLAGIGGTVTNISAVKRKLVFYDGTAIHKSSLSKGNVEYFLNLFRDLSVKGIAELMPFEPLRADIITSGILIILEIMNLFAAESIYVSDYGIQFGILSLIADNQDSPLLL